MTAAILALPRTPEWDEVDKRHALVGLAPYRDPIMWAYFDRDSDVCVTAWYGDDTPTPDGFWHAIIMGQVRNGWIATGLAAARRMIALHPGHLIASWINRAEPSALQKTPLERFLWTTCAMTDVGSANDGRMVRLDPAVVNTRLAVIVIP